jgi:hypothetical protein
VRIRSRLPAGAALAALALVPVAALPATAAAKHKHHVKTPKSGKYSGFAGAGRPLTLYISGKTVQLVSFRFACGSAHGTTNLNDIPLKKTKKGYKFSISAHGLVTYSDSNTHPDENGAIFIKGRFTRSGKNPKGVLRVKTPRCGSTGDVQWSAKR